MSEPKFRHELKYAINHVDYLTVTGRIKHFMELDKNALKDGSYHVRSLYFDTPDNKALNKKIDGIGRREKFRIRLYNHNDQFIKLEKKMKKTNLCLKVSCPILKEECEKILQGEIRFMKEHKEPLMQELYVNMITSLLAPKVLVDYQREAYIYRPGNVRVTFDSSVQSGLHVVDLFNSGLPGAQVLPNNRVMEVKFDEFLPSIIQDLIQTNRNRPQSISKYAAARIFG